MIYYKKMSLLKIHVDALTSGLRTKAEGVLRSLFLEKHLAQWQDSHEDPSKNGNIIICLEQEIRFLFALPIPPLTDYTYIYTLLAGTAFQPHWQCWLRHVLYLRIAFRHRLRPSDIKDLDRCIRTMQSQALELYNNEDHQFVTINTHQLRHLGISVQRFGSLREVTTFGNESKIGTVVRRVRDNTNGRNECKTLMEDLWLQALLEM
ncbi:hypothetical protein BKA69DRAFT_253157 [Paraphysoderma sedebokerense]|nr:hypothetical protein BKA69DRAFT_253157 [Paraphysoderma sedebokerense]